jgi:segregation and condensation protein A
LEEKPEIHFLTLVDTLKEKMRIVVTFIALLELVKNNSIGIKASRKFNDFVICRINDGIDI